MTHEARDYFDTLNEVAFLMAADDRFRCRCDFNGGNESNPSARCRRFADREDLLCEWCREHKGYEAHVKQCYEIGEDAGAPILSREYVRLELERRAAQWNQAIPQYRQYSFRFISEPIIDEIWKPE
jgi:hypothetical protein